ncbi:MAG TPA: GTPase domain-containing protein [Nannocystaceae bacterium]|nr:GTPase domain-containing protein [Nannocystaceae bacterium]
MTYINHLAKEINCKIVYYGPGLCGKTANLQHIFETTKPESKGKMISLATETERTLFFDFLPIDLGSIRGYKVRFHLYTVPGQVFYDASRKLVLRGSDGVIFVADSQRNRSEANVESFDNLETNLNECNTTLAQVPNVVQYNKRDLAEVMSVEEMRPHINPMNVPEFEAAAKNGTGVFDTLKGLAKLVMSRVGQNMG